MTRRRKVLPARRHNVTDDSLLIRSAESLGRMIGTLQRELDAARQLTGRAADAYSRRDGHDADTRGSTGKTKATTATRATKAKTKSASTAARSTSGRTVQRRSKSAAPNKATERRRAAKAGRGA